MDGLKIQLAAVSDAARMMRARNETIYDLLQQMKKQMNDLSAVWISDGSEAIRLRFMTFSNQFDVQKEVIERYAQFLDRTVSSYDSIEGTIASNASSFH
ncbi:MAG: pore-forming ESAT-6 family protein [Erysipelotrichaceae bacterium]|nr:pore-forming ESAT-6 family protein [Erysipelotrichaceae bacterium]